MSRPRYPALILLASILVVSAAAAQDADSLNPLKALDKAAFEAFVQKPLFDPARQLPAPPLPVIVDTAPPPPPPPEPPPALQLIGVVRSDRGDMAIVHRAGNEKTVVLRNGDKLGDWTVMVRPPVGVTLSQGGRTVDFAIFAKGGAAPRGATAPQDAAAAQDAAAQQGAVAQQVEPPQPMLPPSDQAPPGR